MSSEVVFSSTQHVHISFGEIKILNLCCNQQPNGVEAHWARLYRPRTNRMTKINFSKCNFSQVAIITSHNITAQLKRKSSLWEVKVNWTKVLCLLLFDLVFFLNTWFLGEYSTRHHYHGWHHSMPVSINYDIIAIIALYFSEMNNISLANMLNHQSDVTALRIVIQLLYHAS